MRMIKKKEEETAPYQEITFSLAIHSIQFNGNVQKLRINSIDWKTF